MPKTGIDYFPLNCHLDEKFDLIEAEFGLKGFAVVLKIFQRIYGEHGYYCEWNDEIALLFARRIGLPCGGAEWSLGRAVDVGEDNASRPGDYNLIGLVVNASIRRGIFSREVYEGHGVLTSAGIQRRYLDIAKRRVEIKMKKSYLLLNDGNLPNNVYIIDDNVYRNGENVRRNAQSKVKESKVKESKGDPPLTPPGGAGRLLYYPDDPKLDEAFAAFVAYRKEIKKPMTPRAVELAIGKLGKLGSDTSERVEIINQSVMNGWTGLFPLGGRRGRADSGEEIRKMIEGGYFDD